MAETFSARINSETKNKLETLIEESGLTAKDFMDRLVVTYETSQSRESIAQIKELDNLRHHLARIEEIYISITKEAKDRQEVDDAKIKELQESTHEAKSQVLDMQKRVEQISQEAEEKTKTTEADAALARENAQKEVKNIQETLARAKESRDQSARLAALAEKSASEAEAKAARLQEMADRFEQLQTQLKATEQERDQTNRDLSRLQEDLARAQATIQAVKEEFDRKLTQALEKAEVDKERAVLAAQRKALDEMRELQEALVKCRDEKATLEIELTRLGRDSYAPKPLG